MRLFNGLTRSGDKPVNCASCHNTRVIDTLNWSPSAAEIALSSLAIDSAVYAKLLLKPVGKRLSVAHEGIDLTGEEIVEIRKYVDEVGQKGLEPKKLDINRMLFFLFLVIIAGVAIADLIFFKAVKYKMISIMVLLLSFGWGTRMIVQEAVALGRSLNYTPLQPDKFSHVIQAGENEIDCQYSHHTAESSKSAGIPSMDVCLNCHTLVREATRSGKFEINKNHAAVDSGNPIEWIRLQRLPDFVYFIQRVEEFKFLFYGNFIINFFVPFLILLPRKAPRLNTVMLIGSVVVFRSLSKASLVPYNHPFFKESQEYHNL